MRESLRSERPSEVSGRFSDQSARLAEVIRDRDRPEAPTAEQVHQLRDAQPPVAEGGMHVEIGQLHDPSIGNSAGKWGQVQVRQVRERSGMGWIPPPGQVTACTFLDAGLQRTNRSNKKPAG